MIKKEEVLDIAKKYLLEKNREYISLSDIDSIGYSEEKEILYGDRAGELAPVFFLEYEIPWGIETDSILLYIDAHKGEVLYSMNATTWIEGMEEENLNGE